MILNCLITSNSFQERFQHLNHSTACQQRQGCALHVLVPRFSNARSASAARGCQAESPASKRTFLIAARVSSGASWGLM